jgi:hypothetical protein
MLWMQLLCDLLIGRQIISWTAFLAQRLHIMGLLLVCQQQQ